MNSPWQVNTLLAFVDGPLQRPPFVTGDVEIDDYLTRELDPSQRTTLAEHAASSRLQARPLVVRGYLFVFFARLHDKIDVLPWDQKKDYERERSRCAAMVMELGKAGLILAPRQAESLFRHAMSCLHRYGLLERCVQLAIAARDGVDGAAFDAAMQLVCNGKPVEDFVHGYEYPGGKAKLLEAIELAHQALGNPPGSHKLSRSMAQARRDGHDLLAQLKGAAHRDLLPIIDQYDVKPGKAFDASAMGLLVGDLSRGSPEERGRIVDNILDLQPIFSASPLFATIWAMPRDTAFGLVNFEFMWAEINRLPAALSAKRIRYGQHTALRMLRGVKNYTTALQEPQAAGPHSKGRILSIEIRTSVPLLKSLAASLPKGDPNVERQIRDLPISDKFKNALLDGATDVERTGSLEAVQNEALQLLARARVEFGKADLRPLASIGSNRSPGRPAGITDRFRALFGQRTETPHAGRPSAPLPGEAFRRYGEFVAPYVRAVVHAMACNIDVTDDLEALRQLHQSELRRVNDHLQSPHTIRTAAEIRRLPQTANYQSGSWLRDVMELCEAIEWADMLDNLDPRLRDELAGLTVALLPISDSSAPASEWLRRAGDAIGAHADELAELMLANYPASGGWGSLGQQDLVQAVLWLSPQLSPGIAARVDAFGRHCLEDLPGHGARNKRLGNAALWALSEMRDGAGVAFLEKIIASSPFLSVQSMARAYLNKSAVKGGIDPLRAGEMAFPDCGLASGPARMPLKGGAALFGFAAPDRIDLKWQRDDGSIGVNAASLQISDPEGVKAAKKRAVTLQADMSGAARWLPVHYRSQTSMAFDEWTQRYLNHGTLGPLARNLVWCADAGDTVSSFICKGDMFVGADGSPAAPQAAEIRLWHPLDSTPEELERWRAYALETRLSQPFAQIWRSVFRAEDAGHWLAAIEGRAISHKPFAAAARELGWSSPPKASALEIGDCIYWFDEEASIYVELAIDANGDIKDSRNAVTLKTGALSFWRSELGAKPSKNGLKKKRPIEPGAIDGKLLSEIVYSAMMMTDIGACGCQLPFEDYSARLRYDLPQTLALLDEAALTVLPVNRDRIALIEAWLRHLPVRGRNGPTQERVTIEAGWLMIAGRLQTYCLHMPTARMRTGDRAKRLYITNADEQPSEHVYVPHAGDPVLLQILANVEHLLKDDRPGQKKIGAW